MLFELGFPIKFVRWVMECVQTVSYSLLINGAPTPPFKAGKGLRQGDPLSPYLCALSMEHLARCLHSLDDDKRFKFHPRCKRARVTHLMFADDLLLFCRGDEGSIIALFEQFEKVLSCIRFGGKH